MTLRGELLKIAAARIVRANSGVEKNALVMTAAMLLPMVLPYLQQAFRSPETRRQEQTDQRMGLMQSRLQLQQMEKAKLDNINRWKVKGFYNPLAQNNQQRGGMRSMFGVNMPFFGGGASSTPPASSDNQTGSTVRSGFNFPAQTDKNMFGNLRNITSGAVSRNDLMRN